MVHLHIYAQNLRYADASYQCVKDFASSITYGDDEAAPDAIARYHERLWLMNSRH
jgi:hypothetical protein